MRRESDNVSAEAEELILIDRARTDSEAFGILYERYYEKIYNYVYYRTGNPDDAEDLTSRIFERAMKHIPNYQHQGVPFSAWLYRIAHNLVANWHRDRSRRHIIALDDVAQYIANEENPERAAQSSESRERLMVVMARLPADRQELLVLKFIEHLSNAEIGSIMGRSEGAIKSLYHRTLLAMREELTRTEPDSPKREPLWKRRFRRGNT